MMYAPGLLSWDVVVAGAGPAGWSAATSFAEHGFRTALVAPEPYAHWSNNYGAWHDEIEDGDAVAARVWPRAEVRLDADRVHVLERSYIRIDNHALRARIRAKAEANGLHVIQGAVAEAEHDADGSRLTIGPPEDPRNTDGETIEAVLVIDATGHKPKLIRPGRGRAPGVQVAFGVEARLEAGDIDPNRMVLMDFSADYLPADEREPPTFLYAMPLDDGDVFVEETSLVARPPVDLDMCRRRLELRMAHKGWRLGPAKEVEHCFIPMGGPAPPRAQRVVPVGGAAAAVHPATGYMLANVLRTAPRLAQAVHEVRDRRDAEVWSRAGWKAVWPADRARAWSLYRYGMEVLVSMGVSSTAGFFDTFFKIRTEQWQGYLSGDVSSRDVAAAMWAVFGQASPALRWQLMSRGFSALMSGGPA